MEEITERIIEKEIEKSIKPEGASPWYYMVGGVWVRTKNGIIKVGGTLIKKRKPCLEGDYVHIHRWEGCYRVVKVSVNGFVIMKNRNRVTFSWEQFRCLKGHGDSELTRIKREERENKKIVRTLFSLLVK